MAEAISAWHILRYVFQEKSAALKHKVSGFETLRFRPWNNAFRALEHIVSCFETIVYSLRIFVGL